MNPLDYSLCCQTVTVYRKAGKEILRKVAENCHLSRQTSTPMQHYGKSRSQKFLLIIPGNDTPLQPGDRIYDGIGPQNVVWEKFLPAAVPELMEIGFVRPCFWEGEVTHWEAGTERSAL